MSGRTLLVFLAITVCSTAFSLHPTAQHNTLMQAPTHDAHRHFFTGTRFTSSLHLFGKKDKDKSKDDSSSGDILNSPAFLSKKIEVLQKDLEAAESDVVLGA